MSIIRCFATESSQSQPPVLSSGWTSGRGARVTNLLARRVATALLVLVPALALARGAAAQTVAFPRGSIWKYEASGTALPTDPGNDWRTPFYPDFEWSYGPAPLGYGEPYIVTTVPYGPDSTNKSPTTYFRRTFSVGVPSSVHAMTMDVSYDDGFVLYLNGNEIVRRSIAPGPVAYDSLALDHEGGTYETIDLTAYIPSLQGSNFLAVELHQADRASDDLVWDASLTYSTTPSLTRGPYLQIGSSTGLTVRWRTNFATDSRVRYGTSIGNLTSSTSSAGLTGEHEIALTGLTPDTRYYYSVGTSGAAIQGGDAAHTFLTAPAPGSSKPTRFWVIGDAGTGSSAQLGVRDAFAAYTGARDPDQWFMLGDNAYQNGNDSEYQAAVFDIYGTMLKKSVLWTTRGNHDNLFAPPASDYYDIFSMPMAGEAGGLASGSEAYYSLDYGNMHIVCLDSEGSDRTTNGAMLTWLQNDLAATDKDWIIAFWHHPPYTHGSHNSDNDNDSEGKMKDMRQNALPILEAAGVDLVLCGHSHGYERSMLIDGHYGYSNTLTPAMKLDSGDGRMNGDGPYEKPHLGGAPHEGAVYTVAGSSGGQVGGGTLDHPVMIRSSLDYGSLVIDVDGLRLDSRFLDNARVVKDSFTIVKGTLLGAPGPRTPVPGVTLAPARPNPFDSKASIAYSIPKRGTVRLSIMDLNGRRVRTLVSGEQGPGTHEAAWDGRNEGGRELGAGVYFSILEYGGGTASKKLIRVR